MTREGGLHSPAPQLRRGTEANMYYGHVWRPLPARALQHGEASIALAIQDTFPGGGTFCESRAVKVKLCHAASHGRRVRFCALPGHNTDAQCTVHVSNPQVHSVGEMQSCNVYSSCSYFFLLIMLPKGQGRKQGSLMCIEAITVV